jgi:hypothetical protein
MKWLKVAALVVLPSTAFLAYRIATAQTPVCKPGSFNDQPPNACPLSNEECLNGTCCVNTQAACDYGGNPSCCSTLTYGCQDAGPGTVPTCCAIEGASCSEDSDCCNHKVLVAGALSSDVKQGKCLHDGGAHTVPQYCSYCTANGNHPSGLGCCNQLDPQTDLCGGLPTSPCSAFNQCVQPTGYDGGAICGGGGAGVGQCCLVGGMYCTQDGGECCSGVCDLGICESGDGGKYCRW